MNSVNTTFPAGTKPAGSGDPQTPPPSSPGRIHAGEKIADISDSLLRRFASVQPSAPRVASPAPKGHHVNAQGNALGIRITHLSKP